MEGYADVTAYSQTLIVVERFETFHYYCLIRVYLPLVTPDANNCKRFYRGELEKKDTFSKRILTEEPKFVQKRKDTEK